MTGIGRSRPSGLRRIIGVVSDGTGRPQDEVVVLATLGAAVILGVAVRRGISWVVETATDQDPWPDPPAWSRS
ncbi:hypothetical protein AAII07_15615 [Microvirga sp. 0TCS3.31]